MKILIILIYIKIYKNKEKFIYNMLFSFLIKPYSFNYIHVYVYTCYVYTYTCI